MLPALERFDDDHVPAAARAWRTDVVRLGWFAIRRRWRGVEQLPGKCDADLARGRGEQAVVTDAVEAAWQDVEQEPTDKRVSGKRHNALAFGAIAAIILVAERNALFIERD